MEGERAPDLSRCFGKQRQQTAQYALTFCIRCPLLKSCVRTAWGMEGPPQRTRRRGAWWEGSPRALAGLPPEPPPTSGYYQAT